MLQNDGRRAPSRQHDGVRGQEPPRDDNAALGQGFEGVDVDPGEGGKKLAGEIGNVVGPLLENRVRCLLKAPFEPTKDALDHLLGVQEFGFQLIPQFPQDRT
jgi:hypothetical protein